MESIAFYEGVLRGYEREIIALERFGNGRIGQWRELLRDYKESRQQVDTIRAEIIDACIETFAEFAAEIWDNKYEPDKIGCTVERWCGMPGNDLIRKYRDRLYKRPTAIENLKEKK